MNSSDRLMRSDGSHQNNKNKFIAKLFTNDIKNSKLVFLVLKPPMVGCLKFGVC